MKKYRLTLITLSAAGLLAARGLAHAQAPCGSFGPPHHGPRDMTAMLTHVLSLTNDQKTKVQALVENVRPQLDAIHEQARTSADVVIKQLNTQIRPLLDADQQKKLDAMETLRHSGPGPE